MNIAKRPVSFGRWLCLGMVTWGSTLLAGCGGGQAGERGFSVVVDTLASGAIQVRNSSTGLWGGSAEWRLIEELRLGSVEGGGPEIFGQVVDIQVDPLGRLYLADGQSREIRVFDSEGVYVRSIGGRGSGPGEFLQINAITWDRDGNLWAKDFGNRRWTVFDTAGTYLTSHPRTQTFLMQPWPGGFDKDGRMIDLISQDRLIRYFPGDARVDTISLSLDPAENFELRTANSWTTLRVPFAPGPVWVLDHEGLVWYGFGNSFRIARRTLENDTLLVLEREYEQRAVLGTERELALSGIQSFVDQGMEIDVSRIPSMKPAFDGFLADDRGYLWVYSFEVDLADENPRPVVRAFHVFDDGGVYLGELATPSDFTPVTVPRIHGAHIYAVTVGEYDVPYVVGLRIEGRD